MSSKFDQSTLPLHAQESLNRLKVSKLMLLLEEHPYKANVEKAFNISDIEDEYIQIDNIDLVYLKIASILEKFKRFNIKARTRDISLVEHIEPLDEVPGLQVKFVFDKYVDQDGSQLDDLEAFAIHDAKATFLNQYDMAKYANRLYKDQHYDLIRQNIEYFRSLATKSKRKDKLRSYRLLEHKNELFVRGITSVDQYNEYGIDFAFVVGMLVFHGIMKDYPGDNYMISSAALSASKLHVIVQDKTMKVAKGFGKVSSSTVISTNDLGNASFKFLNIIKVGIQDSRGFYIFPSSKSEYKNQLLVTHSTKVDNALSAIKEHKSILRSSDEFIEELEKVKGLNTPNDLRTRILFKIESKNSPFKPISSLKDLFKPHITNNLENFARLLEMCRKAEELEITYDLKDKLRVIISDIIFHNK
jgi:hypothetical protein